MTNKEILKADVLDILFEHRNKTYGAYALRKGYNSRLGTALGIAISTVLLILLFSLFKHNANNGSDFYKNDGDLILTQVDLPKEKTKEPDQPKIKPKSVVAEVDYQDIIVVKDNEADKFLPDNDDISKAETGNENREGQPSTGLVQVIDNNKIGGNGNEKSQEVETFFEPDEIPASFPGGVNAWLIFLRRYLQTPDELEAGQRVEVKVKFWINADGSLSRFEIIQSGGSVFDKEVLRVMKKMPRWEPAVQNKNKVAVAYTQPVIFVGVEE